MDCVDEGSRGKGAVCFGSRVAGLLVARRDILRMGGWERVISVSGDMRSGLKRSVIRRILYCIGVRDWVSVVCRSALGARVAGVMTVTLEGG